MVTVVSCESSDPCRFVFCKYSFSNLNINFLSILTFFLCYPGLCSSIYWRVRGLVWTQTQKHLSDDSCILVFVETNVSEFWVCVFLLLSHSLFLFTMLKTPTVYLYISTEWLNRKYVCVCVCFFIDYFAVGINLKCLEDKIDWERLKTSLGALQWESV